MENSNNSDRKDSNIKTITITKEMRQSYLDYAMSVIVSRALPDVRDGLKPVQRRILFSMKESGLDYNKSYRKSASTVGNVISRYHPHGDAAIYDAMVRMAQDFSMSLKLVDGQGNFGSMDGDKAAAYRYTESRLAKSASFLLADIEKETVRFTGNFDGTRKEPTVLPAQFPNILVNGAGGIAVGMATNIPPHNIGEVVDAACAYIDNPEITIDELSSYVKGPDFPTGALILGTKGINSAYQTGRGSIVMRARHNIETLANNKQAIILTEVPFQVNKARMVEKIADCVKNKIIEGIHDLRDESDRHGVRVVIEIKKDFDHNVVLNLLYKHTPMQSFFGANMIALDNGRPKMMNLQMFIEKFIQFREEVITNRTKFDLSQARKKAHLLLGMVVAISHIDEIIAIIKNAKNSEEAREKLTAKQWDFSATTKLIDFIDAQILQFVDERSENFANNQYTLTEVQANAILDMKLHKLTGLERDKIVSDLKIIVDKIQELLKILASKETLFTIMKDEMLLAKKEFAMPRRTDIVEGEIDSDIEDLIQKEDMVVTISHQGYIKRVPLSMYRAQKRGGKGKSGMKTKDEDFVAELFVTDTHTPILFFASNGLAYELKTYKLPLGSLISKGKPIVNLLPVEPGSSISSVLALSDIGVGNNIDNDDNDDDAEDGAKEEKYIVFATSHGNVRRNKLSDFLKIRANGKIAMRLDGDEKLVSVVTCTLNDNIFLTTVKGRCIRFKVEKIRCVASRASNGVRGLRLKDDDMVVGMSVLNQGDFDSSKREEFLNTTSAIRRNEITDINNFDGWNQITKEEFSAMGDLEQNILTITSRGMGKKSSSYDYRLTNRGGVGITNIDLPTKSGDVVASFPVKEDAEIMLITNQGQMIRCHTKDIRLVGRRSQGVMVFRLPKESYVAAVSLVIETDDENDGNSDNNDDNNDGAE